VPGNKGLDDIEFNLPPHLKQVNYRLGKVTKNRLLCYRFSKATSTNLVIIGDFLKKKF